MTDRELMQPTNKLRFIERDCYVKNGEPFTHPFKQRVLQQWWHTECYGEGEWRDVPLEAEQ